MAFVIKGELIDIATGKVFDQWKLEPKDHGWKDISHYFAMLKERKQYNKAMILKSNGYSQITDCGRFSQNIEVINYGYI